MELARLPCMGNRGNEHLQLLQVGKLVVGNLFKYLLSQEVKSYLFISSKIFIVLLEENQEP